MAMLTPPGLEAAVRRAPKLKTVTFNPTAPLVKAYTAEKESSESFLAQENEELSRQNAELRMHIALMSGSLAAAHATAGNSWPAEWLWPTDVTLDCHVSGCTKGITNWKPKRMRSSCQSRASSQSRDASPAASTTASTCGFTSEADDSSDCENSLDQDESHRTTMMMRNVPHEYTRADILDLIDRKGFSGVYDLVYMPIAFQTGHNHGYFFINFTTQEDAERFQNHFEGFSDWLFPSDKICEVIWSDQSQGLAAGIQRYRDSPVMHESVDDRFKPLLFSQGQRIPFPKPTKKIRAPRLRK